jgi:hypothetical protein
LPVVRLNEIDASGERGQDRSGPRHRLGVAVEPEELGGRVCFEQSAGVTPAAESAVHEPRDRAPDARRSEQAQDLGEEHGDVSGHDEAPPWRPTERTEAFTPSKR